MEEQVEKGWKKWYFSGIDISFSIFSYSNGHIFLINGPKVVKYTYFFHKFLREIDINYKVAYGIKVIGKACRYGQQKC